MDLWTSLGPRHDGAGQPASGASLSIPRFHDALAEAKGLKKDCLELPTPPSIGGGEESCPLVYAPGPTRQFSVIQSSPKTAES